MNGHMRKLECTQKCKYLTEGMEITNCPLRRQQLIKSLSRQPILICTQLLVTVEAVHFESSRRCFRLQELEVDHDIDKKEVKAESDIHS